MNPASPRSESDPVILFPAIDLKDGMCVRLVQGDMNEAMEYNDDPVAQARDFARAGVEWLHVVDLNGAFAGKPVNAAVVQEIVSEVELKMQLGGGIRDIATIEKWLEVGVARVILGTVALKQPEIVREACRLFPDRIAVGIDAREGRVAVEGWAEQSEKRALDLALAYEDAGVAAIIYTDIERDGNMTGPNIEQTVDLAFHLTTPVIVSGGVTTIDDLKEIAKHRDAGIIGAISGRAVYDGRISLKEALKVLREAA